jgi:hypothetical protein
MTKSTETRFRVILPRLENVRILHFSDRRLHALTILLILSMIMAPAAAWSYQAYVIPQLETPLQYEPDFTLTPEKDLFSPSSPAVADVCLPLLRSIHHPNAAPSRTQRSAGTAAAQLSVISLALGVRYALGPREDTGTRGSPALKTSENSGASHALAVAQYRDCHKKQALESSGRNAGRFNTSTK